MRKVTKTEFSRHTYRVLAEVEDCGEPVIITERGIARWKLTPDAARGSRTVSDSDFVALSATSEDSASRP